MLPAATNALPTPMSTSSVSLQTKLSIYQRGCLTRGLRRWFISASRHSSARTEVIELTSTKVVSDLWTHRGKYAARAVGRHVGDVGRARSPDEQQASLAGTHSPLRFWDHVEHASARYESLYRGADRADKLRFRCGPVLNLQSGKVDLGNVPKAERPRTLTNSTNGC
jgi:hypothetical protein